MGKINLLKNGYRGKVGQTVGQQWNGQLTLRTHNDHNTSKTEAQLKQRASFKEAIEFTRRSYPYVVNLVPPKKFPGTKWNFTLEAMSMVMGGTINFQNGLELGDYKKKNIMLPFFPVYNGKYYAYIYKYATNGSLSPNDYKLSAIPIFDPSAQIPSGIVAPTTGQILDKSIIATLPTGIPPKGFLVEVTVPPPQTVIYMIAMQGRGILNGYKSAFSPCIPAININDAQLVDN